MPKEICSVQEAHLFIHDALQPLRLPMLSTVYGWPRFMFLAQHFGRLYAHWEVVELAMNDVALFCECFSELQLMVVE